MGRSATRARGPRTPHRRLHCRHDRPLRADRARALVQRHARTALTSGTCGHSGRWLRQRGNESTFRRMTPALESFEAETLALMREAHELAWARLMITGVVAGHNVRRMQKLTARH